MIKKTIQIFMIFNILFAVSGCGNKLRQKQDPKAQAKTLEVIPGVDFKEVFEKLLKSDCLECHSTYNNYQLVAAQSDRFLDAVLTGRMPKGRPVLTNSQKSILQTWVNNGAPEFADKVSKPIALAPTYTSLFVNVIGPKCASCHTGDVNSPAPPDVNFSNYEDMIVSNEKYAQVFGDGFLSKELGVDSEIIFLVTDTNEPMPPLSLPGNDTYNKNPLPQLTQPEIKALQEWILKGFPND